MILVRILALDESWGLMRSSNLKHRVLMLAFNLTLLAEIKVRTDTALVPDSLDWVNRARITSDFIMDFSSLISSSLSKVIYHQSLESLGSVGPNLFLENLQ